MTDQSITPEEMERISAENRREWLDVLDNASNVANRLDLLAVLFSDADISISNHAVDGLVSMLQEASETIRSLSQLVQESKE